MQLNLNNTVMLINYVKVFQQAGSIAIMQAAQDTTNQTGVGGAVGRKENRGSRKGFVYFAGTLQWLLLISLLVNA